MGDILLNVEGMKVYYPVKGDFGSGREFVKAVDGVSFEVRKGEVFGIVGESGCGKSTLGRGICKLETPTAGKIILAGEDISSYGRKQMRAVRKKVQMVFQDPYASLDPRMTVAEIIGEGIDIHHLAKTKQERHHQLGREKTSKIKINIFQRTIHGHDRYLHVQRYEKAPYQKSKRDQHGQPVMPRGKTLGRIHPCQPENNMIEGHGHHDKRTITQAIQINEKTRRPRIDNHTGPPESNREIEKE